MSNGSELLDRPARSPRDAAREARHAREQLDGYAREYEAVRQGGSVAVIAKARGGWGLALYEYAYALVAQAEAEDRNYAERRNAVGSGTDRADECTRAPATPNVGAVDLASARERQDACWREYDSIRRNPDPDATDHARGEWEQAMYGWVRALFACKTAEDQENMEARRRRQEHAMQFRPTDAFPRARPLRQEIVSQSRERARRESIERDRSRYERR